MNSAKIGINGSVRGLSFVWDDFSVQIGAQDVWAWLTIVLKEVVRNDFKDRI